MISKFVQQNQVDSLRRWLSDINFSNAEVLVIEHQLQEALALSAQHKVWSPTPIAPLAEPTNLQELVGDHFQGAAQEMQYQASRVDNTYRWLNDTNNFLRSELEGLESIVMRATDAVQDISVFAGQDAQQFYWVAETFNTTATIDLQATTALIDTDHGLCMLGPTQVQSVKDFQAVLNFKETRGIPGCNLLVIDRGTAGSADKEPFPLLESAPTTDFGALFDGDSISWFEIERNFVTPKQKCSKLGRAYVRNSAGQEVDVKAVTADLDWTATVQWFNASVPETGADGKGVPLAEFIQVDVLNSQNPATNAQLQGLEARLVLDLVFPNQAPLSFLNLVPLLRGTQPIRVESITAFAGQQQFVLAKDVDLSPTAQTTTLLNKEIFRRTGAQTAGGLFSIPTNRDIDRIEIRLTARPEQAAQGLAHPFQEKYEETRREQRVVFFSMVSHDYEWSRIPAKDGPRSITTSYSGPKLLGSIGATLDNILFNANQFQNRTSEAIQRARDTTSSLQQTLDAVGLSQQTADLFRQINKGLNGKGGDVGAVLGQLSSFLGGGASIVGGIMAAVELGEQLFNFQKEVIVHEVRRGYDIFDGHRAGIALRDVGVLRMQFSDTSVVQTVRREFQAPVRKIGLFVKEYIPEGWGAGDWITYFVSTDGQSWTQLSKTSDVTIDQGYTPEQPTDKVYFRAVLRGNPQDPSTTPRIEHALLQGLPA